MVLSNRKASSLIPLPSLLGVWVFGTRAKERFSDVGERRVVNRDGKCGELAKRKLGKRHQCILVNCKLHYSLIKNMHTNTQALVPLEAEANLGQESHDFWNNREKRKSNQREGDSLIRMRGGKTRGGEKELQVQ